MGLHEATKYTTGKTPQMETRAFKFNVRKSAATNNT
jgi:hypothetical protein